MKKDFLLIAAAATMLTACVNLDTLKDYNNPQGSKNDEAIGFTPFAEKATNTKGDNSAENSTAKYIWSFTDNHDDFVVWGFKSNGFRDGKTITENAVFNGVTVDASDSYSYSPLRFWDKNAAKYHFYAAAPASPTEGWTFVPDDIENANTLGEGYWTTTATIIGVNLKNRAAVTGDNPIDEEGPDADLSNYFKGSGEIDKLIAAPCEIIQTYYAKSTPEKVHLNFIHILSKLNVTIKKAATLDDYTVKLLSFSVKSVPSKADFNENDAAANQNPGNNSRWNRGTYTSTVDYEALTNLATQELTVLTTKNYIVESLVIPQDIRFKRVALDGAHHDEVNDPAVYYEDYEEYTKGKFIEALDEDEFNDILDKKDENTASEEELAAITKIPAILEAEFDAVTTDSEPYFYIKYSINGEDFEAHYNLAAAFGADPTEDDPETTNVDETGTISFNEGWQNTLNILINPNAIEFTADVAEWAKVEAEEYEVIK